MDRIIKNKQKISDYDLKTTSQYEADKFTKAVLKTLNVDIYDLAEQQSQ